MKDKNIDIRKVNLLLGAFFIIFGTVFLYFSLNISSTGETLLGPETFPVFISIGILIFGISLIILRNKESYTIVFSNIDKLIQFALALLIYVIFMNTFGYYITSLFIFPILLLIGGVRKTISIILYTILFIVAAFIFFDLLLDVPLPGGILV